MIKHTLESGAILEVAIAPFELAERLNDAFLKAVQESGVSIDGIADIDIDMENSDSIKNGIAQNTKLISFFLEKIISVTISKELKTTLKECFGKCTYKGERIIDDTFEPVEARADYYLVCYHILKENITPFFSRIGSLFSTFQGKSTSTQKPKPTVSPTQG